MKQLRRHKWGGFPIRFICLVLMVVLSADTLLATVGTGADCGRTCRCCAPSNHEPVLIENDNLSMAAGCCDSTTTPSCHTSGKTPTNQLLAVVENLRPSTMRPALHPGDMIVTTLFPAVAGPQFSSIDPGPGPAPAPIYLQVCRLIC